MATKLYSEAELDQLRRYPDAIPADELIRFFTLMPGDVAFVNGHRGETSRIGVAVQLCTLPWLGFVPDDVAAAPGAAVQRLCQQLSVPAAALAGYGVREQTRTDHLREVSAFLGWRAGAEVEFKELDQFLLARAMEHDSPSLLFQLACEHLRSSRLIRPGPVWLLERVATAREAAKAETFTRLEHLLSPALVAGLDRLLVVDDELGCTRLHWLGAGATQPSPAALKAEIAKLRFLRGIAPPRWTCRCCLRSGAGSWPLWGAVRRRRCWPDGSRSAAPQAAPTCPPRRRQS